MRTASILIPLLSLLIIMFIFSEYAGVKETKESVETLKIRAAEEKGSFSFAVLGDSSTVPGCTECQGNAVLAKLVQKINQNPPDFIVYTGDGPEQGGPILYLQAFRNSLGELKAPWYPVLGNHEIIRGAAADGTKGDGEENYLSVFKDKLPVRITGVSMSAIILLIFMIVILLFLTRPGSTGRKVERRDSIREGLSGSGLLAICRKRARRAGTSLFSPTNPRCCPVSSG